MVLAPGVLGDVAQHVLEVEDAAHVVGVLPHHGHARVARAHEQAQRGGHGLGGVDGDHVGTGHHDLAHQGLPQLDHAAQHLAVLVLNGLRLPDLVDHLTQLLAHDLPGLGLGQGGGAPETLLQPAPGGPQGVDPQQQAGQDQQDALGVAPSQGARGQAHDPAQQQGVEHQRHPQDLPPGGQDAGDGQGQQDRGEHVHRHPGAAHGGQHLAAASGQLHDLLRPPVPLVHQVLGGGPGHAHQRRLPRGQDGPEGERRDGAEHQEGDRHVAHACRSARKVSSRVRWSSNISCFCLGSAWS